MFVSLKSRLIALVILLTVAAISAGMLMVGLFRQSSTARVGQASAELERACDAISDAYRFYSSGWLGVDPSDDPSFRKGLTTVLQTALARRPGIEGGIWQTQRASLAYAYPTYEGSGPKTDLPQAEIARITAINRSAALEDRPYSNRFGAPSQTLLLTACPLPGPIPEATAWTMTRVMTFAGRAYRQLMAGLIVLLTTVVAAAVFLTRLIIVWSRHTNRIRSNLQSFDLADLPALELTGERELDRIVGALNDATSRLLQAREQAQEMASKMATSERLAAIGRVTAGVAHEIRNPLAAMRLKAENALAKGGERMPEALTSVLEQIARLDRLVRRLLNVTAPEQAKLQRVDSKDLLRGCRDAYAEEANAHSISLVCESDIEYASLDPYLMRLALDNLLSNAIHEAPVGSRIQLKAYIEDQNLIFSVSDTGMGPPPQIENKLFEQFVSGRPDGSGLGLSIVREVAEAHGGTARYRRALSTTIFEVVVPWRAC